MTTNSCIGCRHYPGERGFCYLPCLDFDRYEVSVVSEDEDAGHLSVSPVGSGPPNGYFTASPDGSELQYVPEGFDAAPVSPLDTQVAGDHYKGRAIQPIEYAHANSLDFFQGSVVKYVTRWRDKGGLADLEKAKHFLELYMELEQRSAA